MLDEVKVTKTLWILFCGPVEAVHFMPLYAANAQDARRQADAWLAQNGVAGTDLCAYALVAHPEGYRVWGVPEPLQLPGRMVV